MTTPATPKRRSHAARLLDLLADRRRHTMAEMLDAGGYRYGGRLHELRHQGYEIETVRVGVDEFEYVLIRAPDERPVVTDQRGQVLLLLDEAA